MPKTSAKADNKTEKFEVLLKHLEEAVEKLEEGELSLDDSLKVFEEGMKLVKVCQARLEDAQKKIEVFTKDKKIKDLELDSNEL